MMTMNMGWLKYVMYLFTLIYMAICKLEDGAQYFTQYSLAADKAEVLTQVTNLMTSNLKCSKIRKDLKSDSVFHTKDLSLLT